MKNLAKWMLGAAVLAGSLGLGATDAQAARIGVYVRGPVAYVPPCPGPGYAYTAGYWENGYWVPGAWHFRGGPGPGVRFGVGYGHGRIGYRHFDRGGFRR